MNALDQGDHCNKKEHFHGFKNPFLWDKENDARSSTQFLMWNESFTGFMCNAAEEWL